MPIVGWLVGSNGPGWVVLGRAIGFHVAEAACCFILAKSTQNPEKHMLSMQREQRALLELQRFERIAALERRIFEHAFAAFDQVEQQLGAAGPVKALPAPGETTEVAKAATRKRKSAKAITARIRDARCQPGKRQARLKASAMGTAPFISAAELLEVEETERRRKLAEASAFLLLALVGGGRPAHAVLREAAEARIAERTLYHGKRGTWDRECPQRVHWRALGLEGANAGRRRQALKM